MKTKQKMFRSFAILAPGNLKLRSAIRRKEAYMIKRQMKVLKVIKLYRDGALFYDTASFVQGVTVFSSV